MKTWCLAVCDKHGEGRHICLSNPVHTYQYLLGNNTAIEEFMGQHGGCGLRLVCTDEQLEQLHKDGWRRIEKTKKYYQEYYSLSDKNYKKWVDSHPEYLRAEEA